MSVTRIDDQIIIEPAHNGIVYVPYYDSRVVYGHWYWAAYPPVYWAPYPYYVRRPHSLFYWHSGINITFNYYFTTFNWHQRHLIVVNHRNSHYYRPRKRIITSEGAHRWHQKPQQIYRVTEGKTHAKQRDDRRLSNSMLSKKRPYNERRQLTDNKVNLNNERHRDRLKKIIKQQNKPKKGDQFLQRKSDLNTRNRAERLQQDKAVKSLQRAQRKNDLNTRNRSERLQQDKAVKRIQRTQRKNEQRTHGGTKIYRQENDRQMR